jgi:hypothetical protein
MRYCAPVALFAAAGSTMIIGLSLGEKARAFPMYGDAWIARYPTSTLPQRMEAITGSWCNACHIPTTLQSEGSCYRLDLRERLYTTPMTIEEAIVDLEWRDSDSDGVPNIVEILMNRSDLPGHVGYSPGLIGPLGTSPCGPAPTVPVSNQSETPAWCYANCDGSIGSPMLTPNDFLCFINRYAEASLFANCDGSTATPALTPNDFQCFLNAYATGCP